MDCRRLWLCCRALAACSLLAGIAVAAGPVDSTAPEEVRQVQAEKQPAAGKGPIPKLPEEKVVGEPPSPPPAEPPPPQPIDQPPALPSSPFTLPPDTGYRAGSAVTPLGINVPLLVTPASVDVVPRAAIADQQALRTEDLLRNVAGAITNPSPIDRFNQFTLRGFPISDFELRRNGFVDLSLVPRELADIERVEFLKGPAAVLYGGGQPGGVVNFITRMPQPEPANSAEVQFGSFDLRRFVGDSTGPVPGSDSMFYRGIVAVEDSRSFRDFGLLQRVLVAPTLTWVIDRDTTLTVQPEFLYTRLFFDSGLVAPNGVLGLVPISRNFEEPDDLWHEDDYRFSMFLDHRFSDDWAVRFAGQAFWYPGKLQRTLPVAFAPPGSGVPADDLLRVKEFASSNQEQYHSLIAALTGKVETGPLKHQLLFGTELGWLVVPDFVLKESNPFVTLLFLNIFNPVYNNATFGAPDPALPFFTTLVEDQTRSGFYAEDLIDLANRWKLLVGARYDLVHDQVVETSNVPLDFPVGGIFPLPVARGARSDPTYFHWSPRVGLVYQPIPALLALYGSYSQSFNPVFGVRSDGGALTPETGVQWEGGLKADLLEKKLSFTAAGYHILKNNVAVPDPTKDIFFFQQLGQARSQGAELSLTGQLTEFWSIIANFAYTDTRVNQDQDPTVAGKRLLSVPLDSASLWTRYNLVQRPEQTIGLAVGLVYVGSRPGDLANSFDLPPYSRWDMGLYYKRRHLSVSLYLENVFDITYYAGSASAFQVVPGAPFTVRSALRWDF